MKKKYLFDRIEIHPQRIPQCIQFVYCHGFSKKVDSYTFTNFLENLEQTKLQDNLEYDIVCYLDTYEYNKPFDYLIKSFANIIYKDSAPDKKELVDFYNKAKKIYEDAKEDKKLLLADPNELIK